MVRIHIVACDGGIRRAARSAQADSSGSELNITKFWGGRASSSSRAALSCVFSLVLPACADSGRATRVVPRDDSSAPTLREERYDGSAPQEDEKCVVNEEFLETRKACGSDADCALISYQAACCSDLLVVGIAAEHLEDAQRCTKPTCACEPGLTRAEDGRAVTDPSSQPVVQCIDQRCSSRVTQRQCGAKRVCAPSEICVTYENVAGGFPPDPDSGDNVYLTFRCEPNPCPDLLDCACAKPLCDARNDALRRCEIKNNKESDLTCRPFAD